LYSARMAAIQQVHGEAIPECWMVAFRARRRVGRTHRKENMSIARQIKTANTNYTDAITKLVGSLEEKIASLPDNPRITRLGSSPRCFTMSSRDLGNNWSVEHHDFKLQYGHIIEAIQKNKDNALNVVCNAIATGKIRIGVGETKHTLALHDDVVKHLVGLWREIWAVEK